MAWRPVLATVPFGVALWYGRGFGLLPASLAASAVFVAATIACGVWDAKERSLIRGVLRGARPHAEELT